VALRHHAIHVCRSFVRSLPIYFFASTSSLPLLVSLSLPVFPKQQTGPIVYHCLSSLAYYVLAESILYDLCLPKSQSGGWIRNSKRISMTHVRSFIGSWGFHPRFLELGLTELSAPEPPLPLFFAMQGFDYAESKFSTQSLEPKILTGQLTWFASERWVCSCPPPACVALSTKPVTSSRYSRTMAQCLLRPSPTCASYAHV
jgi:hypothetical protein